MVVRKGSASEEIKFATDNTKPKRGSVVVSEPVLGPVESDKLKR